MPTNPEFRKSKRYGFVSGRPVYKPKARDIAKRAAECRETWTPEDYIERARWAVCEPVELKPIHAVIIQEDQECTHVEHL